MAEFRAAGLVALFLLITATAPAQVIEFESGGLKYQTLTKSGLTIMVASLPSHVRQLTIVQVAGSNGPPGCRGERLAGGVDDQAGGLQLPWLRRQGAGGAAGSRCRQFAHGKGQPR